MQFEREQNESKAHLNNVSVNEFEDLKDNPIINRLSEAL